MKVQVLLVLILLVFLPYTYSRRVIANTFCDTCCSSKIYNKSISEVKCILVCNNIFKNKYNKFQRYDENALCAYVFEKL